MSVSTYTLCIRQLNQEIVIGRGVWDLIWLYASGLPLGSAYLKWRKTLYNCVCEIIYATYPIRLTLYNWYRNHKNVIWWLKPVLIRTVGFGEGSLLHLDSWIPMMRLINSSADHNEVEVLIDEAHDFINKIPNFESKRLWSVLDKDNEDDPDTDLTLITKGPIIVDPIRHPADFYTLASVYFKPNMPLSLETLIKSTIMGSVQYQICVNLIAVDARLRYEKIGMKFTIMDVPWGSITSTGTPLTQIVNKRDGSRYIVIVSNS
jgi:hypothetical protein